MSFFRYIDPTYYYENDSVGFTTGSNTYVDADSHVTAVIPEGNYAFDYTIRGHGDTTNRLVYFQVVVNGVVVDQWQQESKDINDRYPLSGTNRVIALTAGAQTVSVQVKADNPADVSVDTFRFTLKRWG